jgi:phosphonate transport system permease protein
MNPGARPNPFRTSFWARAGWAALLLYVVYAASRLEITWARFMVGLGNGAKFIGRMLPPNIAQPDSLIKGLTESMEIAILASFLGILISLPVGLLAARNLMPLWATWPARMSIALCRSFHPVIVAILFVKAVGFGALAGILALVVASIGFIGKLFAEAIEEISLKQVEAVRATGAPFMNVISYGVLPVLAFRRPPVSTRFQMRNSPWSASRRRRHRRHAVRRSSARPISSAPSCCASSA